MEIFMKECGKVGLKTAKGLWNKRAGLFMKDHGNEIKGMDTGYIKIILGTFMRVNGRMVGSKGLEYKNMPVEMFIKGNL